MTDRDHARAQLQAIGSLTFQQWFNGRAAYVREWQPVAPDIGEQAMRADYIADKAWWYLKYSPQTHSSLEHASATAATELPTPVGSPRSMRRGWLEEIDMAITAVARQIPSRQWSTTLIPADVFERVWGNIE